MRKGNTVEKGQEGWLLMNDCSARCILYSLDGQMQAVARVDPEDKTKVIVTDGNIRIRVERTLAEYKFKQYDEGELPTFYAC